MREGKARRAGRKGFRPFRGDHLTVEIAVVAAVILTAFAVYFREPLTQVSLSFDPRDQGTAFYGYEFGDETNGGTSVAAPVKGRALAWTCDLTKTYEYGYCGFGLIFDTANSGRGIDLNRFDRVKFTLRYEGSSRALRFMFKNKDPRYPALGAPDDQMVNQTSLPVSSGAQTIELDLDQLAVAEWWKESAPRQSADLAEPELHNVLNMEFLTGVESEAGRQRLELESFEFRGRIISPEAWYGGIALAWLLMLGSLLLLRRRETARWRAQLLETMRRTVETIPHMVWSLDQDGQVHFNRRWVEFTEVPMREDRRLELRRLVHADDVRPALKEWAHCVRSGREFDAQVRIRHHSGEHRWVLAHAVPSRNADGTIAGWYGTCTDVHDRVIAEQALLNSIRKERKKSQQLKWASEHDALTRLPNRRAFEARLEEATRQARETDSEVGLLLVDMDYFKHLNDTLGHGAGDALLKAVARRLKQSVRRQDLVARIGGDEFAVILPGLRTEEDLAFLGKGVAAAIQLSLNIGGHVVRPGASIGGTICPKDEASADDFLKRADAALYALKRSGRGGFRLFEGYMLDDVRGAAFQLARAREVIAEEIVVPLYQPKVAIQGGAVAGFEALLRYQGPHGTLELPATLAEAFKDYELAAKIGEQMQRRVIEDIRGWLDAGLAFGRVSINAAPAEFLRDDYAERLLCILEEHCVPPRCIEIEVTEQAFIERGPEFAARALDVLKSAGVTVSLDDFGTGHSSLSHMRDFPVDLIKIDKSYTALIADDQELAALVAGVIHLAYSLGLEVVAEGVETPRQLELLRTMGCHFAQGHLLGVPIDSTQIRSCILRDGAARTAA